MTTPTDTPRTDAFFNRTDIEWDDEVLFARQLERELTEKTNEVARLRELLEKVMETGVAHCSYYCFERCICGAESLQEDIQAELAKLSPAPEEPTKN